MEELKLLESQAKSDAQLNEILSKIKRRLEEVSEKEREEFLNVVYLVATVSDKVLHPYTLPRVKDKELQKLVGEFVLRRCVVNYLMRFQNA